LITPASRGCLRFLSLRFLRLFRHRVFRAASTLAFFFIQSFRYFAFTLFSPQAFLFVFLFSEAISVSLSLTASPFCHAVYAVRHAFASHFMKIAPFILRDSRHRRRFRLSFTPPSFATPFSAPAADCHTLLSFAILRQR
jgi:polyferredoxin